MSPCRKWSQFAFIIFILYQKVKYLKKKQKNTNMTKQQVHKTPHNNPTFRVRQNFHIFHIQIQTAATWQQSGWWRYLQNMDLIPCANTVSALTEFSLGGKVCAEFTHHLRMALSGHLLLHIPVILLDKTGKNGESTWLGRSHQNKVAFAEGTDEPLCVQWLGMTADAVVKESIKHSK